MLKFRTEDIPGYHTTLAAAAPGLNKTRRHYHGLHGTSEVIGGRMGRKITCEIWISKKEWVGEKPDKLFKELDRLDKLVGETGKLSEDDKGDFPGVKREFKECTFEGFQIKPVGGQNSTGPIRDHAGTLHTYKEFSKTGGAWFVAGTLTWFQTQSD